MTTWEWKSKTKKAWCKVKAHFATELPTTTDGFETFATDILNTYDFETRPALKEAVATMIMHLTPIEYKKSKHFFYVGLKKSLSNSAAYAYIQQQKAIEREATAKLLAEKQDEVAKEITTITN